jgi:hypothetical protein
MIRARQVKSRQQPEHERCDDRERERHAEQSKIDRDLVRARQDVRAEDDAEHALGPNRCEALDERDARRAERCADDAASKCQHDALGEDLTHESPATRAKRETRRQLTPARGASREQKVGHIRADDHQHHGNRAEEDAKRRSECRNHAVLQVLGFESRLREWWSGRGSRRADSRSCWLLPTPRSATPRHEDGQSAAPPGGWAARLAARQSACRSPGASRLFPCFPA